MVNATVHIDISSYSNTLLSVIRHIGLQKLELQCWASRRQWAVST